MRHQLNKHNMKKNIAFLTILVFLLFASSCKKSYKCCVGSTCVTYDKLASETQKQFNDRIKLYESGGYTCN